MPLGHLVSSPGLAQGSVHTWLPRLIKSVNHAYPNLSLEIEVDITPNLRRGCWRRKSNWHSCSGR